MDNPAWRPAQLHSERLVSIQHHFIDEHPASCNAGEPRITHTLPVHMAVAAGHPASALQPHYLVDALTRQLNIQTSAFALNTDWQLKAIPLERTAMNTYQGFTLVFATANLEGVRLAYTGIKKLSVIPSRRFGVLFSGAHDRKFARHCQERLASGTQRFLGISVHELGNLSAPGPGFSADLARLAGNVQRLCGLNSLRNQPEMTHT